MKSRNRRCLPSYACLSEPKGFVIELEMREEESGCTKVTSKALNKKAGGVRPIAVGETIRRLVSSLLMSRVSAKAKKHLEPLQLCVATSGGTEAIVHAARKLQISHGHRKSLALLQVDLKNAFNLVSRRAFLAEVRRHFPGLLAWVRFCYDFKDPYLWMGEILMRSVTGVQQGDPLGPLLFALALHAILKKLKQLIEDLQQAERGEEAEAARLLLLLLFYFDDGVIVAKHSVLRRVLSFFDSHEAKGYGFHLRMDKCSVWWPSAPDHADREAYPSEVEQSYGSGTKVLQAPIGTAEYMEQSVVEHVQSLQPLLDAISELEDLHVALPLLRSCAAVCLNYLLRLVPSACTKKGAKLFDEMMEGCLRTMVGGILPKDTSVSCSFHYERKSRASELASRQRPT